MDGIVTKCFEKIKKNVIGNTTSPVPGVEAYLTVTEDKRKMGKYKDLFKSSEDFSRLVGDVLLYPLPLKGYLYLLTLINVGLRTPITRP